MRDVVGALEVMPKMHLASHAKQEDHYSGDLTERPEPPTARQATGPVSEHLLSHHSSHQPPFNLSALSKA